jgi:hypothetical protein
MRLGGRAGAGSGSDRSATGTGCFKLHLPWCAEVGDETVVGNHLDGVRRKPNPWSTTTETCCDATLAMSWRMR